MKKLIAGGAVLTALIISGCGGGSGSAYSAPKSPGATGAGGGAPLDVTTDPKLGKIIVDAKGRTLYDFVIDKGTMSVCYGGCASLWPPYTTNGKPVAGPGVSSTLIGTTKRKDGSSEVTYAGHPLYYYAHEGKYEVLCHNVEEFGGTWLVVRLDGTPAPG
jgi:predicted lipoprotein with Yx(FWY)xxD motif